MQTQEARDKAAERYNPATDAAVALRPFLCAGVHYNADDHVNPDGLDEARLRQMISTKFVRVIPGARDRKREAQAGQSDPIAAAVEAAAPPAAVAFACDFPGCGKVWGTKVKLFSHKRAHKNS